MPDADARQATQTEYPGNVYKMKVVELCKT